MWKTFFFLLVFVGPITATLTVLTFGVIRAWKRYRQERRNLIRRRLGIVERHGSAA